MDPYLHTIIATLCLFVSYYIGVWRGRKDGETFFWTTLIQIFKAKEIMINEDGDFIVTDMEGVERKVN